MLSEGIAIALYINENSKSQNYLKVNFPFVLLLFKVSIAPMGQMCGLSRHTFDHRL